MRKKTAKLPDGRQITYDDYTPGGIVIEPFYLSSNFKDSDIVLWIRSHKNISFKSFNVGAILVGDRLLDEDELTYLLKYKTSSQDQFFQGLLKRVLTARKQC